MTDDYQLIPVPPPEDYRFKVLPQNAELMQATLVTAREVYPSFGRYLEWAITHPELLMNPPNLYQRSNYPLYLRDASVFEVAHIYNQYKRPAIENALTLIDELHGLHVYQNDESFRDYMLEQGYVPLVFSYEYREGMTLSFAKRASPLVRSSDYIQGELRFNDLDPDPLPLTPANLRATMTPDKVLLMERWRQFALHERTTSKNNLQMLGLKNTRTDIVLIRKLGFDPHDLYQAIYRVIARLLTEDARLDLVACVKHQAKSLLTRQFIMYEGENALTRNGVDLTTKQLNNNSSSLRVMPQGYLMMLYHELAQRGIINEQGQVTI